MQRNISIKDWQHTQQMAAIGKLATGIVHDIKNQLACIGANMSFIELLSGQESVDKYTTNVKRQVAYVNEMIELMMRMGSKDADYSNFNLALLMNDVSTFFKRVSGSGITIKTYVDESVHLIFGCQSLISNSILNLCSNARDAVGDDGVIEVSVKRDFVDEIKGDILNNNLSGECCVLTVKDNGCGIEADKLGMIFEPFFTTKGVLSANAGMGLANVIHTAREHGVSMTVDSKVGVGTTFKLYFKAIVA